MVGWSILQIVAVPVFLLHWGPRHYADWLTLNAAAGLLALLELGINAHLGARMMAEAGRDDTSSVARILSVAFTLYSVILGLAGLLILGGWLYGLDRLLSLTTPDSSEAGLVLALSTLLLVPRQILGSVLSAFGRFSLSIYLSGTQQILGLGAQLAAAAAGGGLLAAAFAHLAVVILVGWALPVILIRRSHPAVTFRLHWPGFDSVRHILYRSGLHAVFAAAMPLLLHLPVLLLQRLGPDGSALILFTTMRTYAGAVRQIVSQLVFSSGMEMTRQYHQGESSRLALLFSLTGRIAGGVAGLLGGLLMVAGEAVFRIWTHGALTFDPVLALVFLAGSLLVVPGLLGSSLLRLTDHAQSLLFPALLQTGLCLLLCLALIPPLGALGAGVAVAVAEWLGIGCLALARASRLFGLRLALLIPAVLAGLCAFPVAAAVAVAAFLLSRPDGLPELIQALTVWTLLILIPAMLIMLPPARWRGLLKMVLRSRHRQR